jgi:hypothetical protein
MWGYKKMKCIFCGQDVSLISNDVEEKYEEIEQSGMIVQHLIPAVHEMDHYECIPCGLSWTFEEHKDNQNWAVRHIRELEKQVETFKEILDLLLKGGHTNPEKIEAYKKLRETDWTVIRKVDIGVEIPEDIKEERQDARNEL